ncbi:MAG: hypothetical protein ACR2QF_00355 [Geminicoccaceae bacterium]
MTTPEDVIEKVARAMQECEEWSSFWSIEECQVMARAALSSLSPGDSLAGGNWVDKRDPRAEITIAPIAGPLFQTDDWLATQLKQASDEVKKWPEWKKLEFRLKSENEAAE